MSITYVTNPGGPKLGLTTAKLIQQDGLYFKDLEGTMPPSSAKSTVLLALPRRCLPRWTSVRNPVGCGLRIPSVPIPSWLQTWAALTATVCSPTRRKTAAGAAEALPPWQSTGPAAVPVKRDGMPTIPSADSRSIPAMRRRPILLPLRRVCSV